MSMMRVKLLAGIAALLMSTGTAHAVERLPQKMLGTWCVKEETELMEDLLPVPGQIHPS
jgi:hypothetical protein